MSYNPQIVCQISKITYSDRNSQAHRAFRTPLASATLPPYNETMQTRLSVKNLPGIIRREVRSTFREMLSDPDAGLILRTSAVQKLKKSLQEKKQGQLREFKEVHKKYRTR